MTQLVFVYNADSGLFNTLSDIAHKLLSPDTYACSLCALTHTPIGMRQGWRTFLETLPVEMKFLHRDEFLQQFPEFEKTPLPLILRQEGDNKPSVWIDAAAISGCEDLENLKMLIASRLNKISA